LRIDLFISPGCPSCPAARKVVDDFVLLHPHVEVHEWDLSRDPGPAIGRGIFATPTLLLDGADILSGVPSAPALEQHLARGVTSPEDVIQHSRPDPGICLTSKKMDASGQ